jgi:2-polyprenyl-3-methyl-5-hydroxy-6-metoxy-1,4-benzoquinol methylase|tara:strand:- start:563 stop:1369 length:807 start_codon:yes stop_codon:yes gene_type:complete
MNCLYCNSNEIKDEFISYNQVEYIICQNCNSLYQKYHYTKKTKDYENFDWSNTIDPEGERRNLEKEKEFKLKNWYGGIPSFVNKLKPGKILDVGAGLGHLLSAVDQKWDKHCIEISNRGCNYIKKNYVEIKITNQELKENIFEKNYFDVVILYHVIEHLEKPLEILKSIRDILKPNGFLILGTPTSSNMMFKIFKENFRLLDPGHLSIVSEKQLKKSLLHFGFQIELIEKPFFRTDYFNLKNLLRILNPSKISPPFYGSIITTFSKKI